MKWVERLFARLSGMYGAKFADLWRGCDLVSVKAIWMDDLSIFSRDEITKGVEACKTRIFPPTLPEFMQLCRPTIDPRTEWTEACEQMSVRLQGKNLDSWSRPEVYWAAVAIGSHDLNGVPWDGIKGRWMAAIGRAKHEPVPEYRVPLPPPGHSTISRDEADTRVRELGAAVGGAQVDYRGWAMRIVGAPGQYPSIAVKFAEEALAATRS